MCRVPFIVALAAACVCHAGPPPFVQQAPLPASVDLNGSAFATPTHAFAVGQSHGLYETFDGGRTWTVRSEGDQFADPYYEIFFFDADHGWIMGNNNDALRTTDGGQTWTQMGDELLGSWRTVEFFSQLSGISMANGACAASIDGGVTWEIRSGYPDCPVTFGSDFADENTGLVAGLRISDSSDGIYRTTDGGRTWTHVLDALINDVVFVNDSIALATGVVPGRIYRSTDGGQSWMPVGAELPDNGPLSDLAVVPGTSTVLGCSHEGDAWISTDLGDSWTQTLEGIGDLPFVWEINVASNGNALLTGVHGLMFASDDAGQSWRPASNGVAIDIRDIEAIDNDSLIAVSENTYVVMTDDKGGSWRTLKPEGHGQVFGADESLRAVEVVDASTIFAAGPGGTVFRTRDGGQTWTSIGDPNLPDALEIHDIAARTPSDIWVVGWNLDQFTRQHAVFRSLDGGDTWFRPFDDAILEHVDWADPDHGWIMHTGGLLHRTTDGGSTWQDITLPDTYFGDNPTIEGMHFIDENVGWVVGWWDYAARTLDGGQTWQTMSFGNNHDIRVAFGVHAVSAEEAWVVASISGGTPVTLHTTDAGQTWTRTIHTDSLHAPTEVAVTPAGDVFVAGGRGYIAAALAGCAADLTGDGVADSNDFFTYLDLFAAGDPAADITGNGTIDGDDFFAYLDLFAQGC